MTPASSHDPSCDLLDHLPNLRLRSLHPSSREAGLLTVSLPWPRRPPAALSLHGLPTHVRPLGRWPGSSWPRRLLLTALGRTTAPENVSIGAPDPSSECAAPPPRASMELLAKSPHRFDYWEQHYLKIQQSGTSLGLAMGLRTGGEIHWWEACRLVILEETQECLTVEMGGAIPHHRPPPDNPDTPLKSSRQNYVHRHNWINGRLYLRIYRNGVCEIYAHHINSKFFDDGLALDDVVPVVGFRFADGPPLSDLPPASGKVWTGSPSLLHLGGVAFDLADAARLATPQQPGSWDCADGFLVWQPYAGVELFGGAAPEKATGTPWIARPEQRLFPRGMARTLRFSASLSSVSPAIARYLPPAWWYGVCEEFAAQPLLPVESEWDRLLEEARRWIRDGSVSGGFEDGAVPRYLERSWDGDGRKRYEAGWDGEVPHAQFLDAWRTGNGDDYRLAMRSAWHFTDVAVDHAAKLVRMHGNAPHAFSLPMNRMQGTLAAYLETGEPYLLETARAVVANAHWQHLNSWPRAAVGRDVCYLRGAVLLYRYFGEEFYLALAREGACSLAHSQRENGSFGDQGGGSGLHQRAGYLSKPWMGLLGLQGVLDYLELFPGDEMLEQTVRRFADWLLAERWSRDGRVTWSYEHDYLGERRIYHGDGQYRELPTHPRWHQETLARLLGYSSLRSGDPAYVRAWRESFINALQPPDTHHLSSNAVAPILEYLPWLQAQLTGATLGPEGIALSPPFPDGPMPENLRVSTPGGLVECPRREPSELGAV